jgi:type II secretory pathway pseudopilin PulG
MVEEFVDDEFIDEEEGNSNRTVVLAAAALAGLFILILLATFTVSYMRRGEQRAQISQIESANATTEAYNRQVTQTVAAMATEAARPTETPTPTPTEIPPTATATFTPEPTDTPVVQAPTGESEDPDQVAAMDHTPTPILAGTSIFAPGQLGATPTPLALAGPGSAGGTLPQTGLETWGAIVAALAFLGLAFAARRLRTA